VFYAQPGWLPPLYFSEESVRHRKPGERAALCGIARTRPVVALPGPAACEGLPHLGLDGETKGKGAGRDSRNSKRLEWLTALRLNWQLQALRQNSMAAPSPLRACKLAGRSRRRVKNPGPGPAARGSSGSFSFCRC